MSASLKPSRNENLSIGQVVSISSYNSVENEGAGKVQETIWQLQDEVRGLQEALVRTRRALDQRIILLRNAHQREFELRAEVGAGRW